jgi:hypothetical protein
MRASPDKLIAGRLDNLAEKIPKPVELLVVTIEGRGEDRSSYLLANRASELERLQTAVARVGAVRTAPALEPRRRIGRPGP